MTRNADRPHLCAVLFAGVVFIAACVPTGAARPPAASQLKEATGMAAFAAHDFARARRVLGGALALARQHGERALLARLQFEIGQADLALEAFAAALAASNEAVRTHRMLGDRRGEAADLVNVGIADDDLGRYDAALLAERRALSFGRALGDRHETATALGALGVAEMHLGHNTDAELAARRSLAMYRATGDRRGVADETGRIGIVEEEAGRYGDALRELGHTLNLQRAVGNVLGEAKALNNIGIVDEHLGRYATALREEIAARTLFRKIHDRLNEANAAGDIGIVYADLGRFGEALQAHEEALAVHRALGDRLGEAQDLTNAGIAAEDVGRYDHALRVLERALAIERAIRDPLDEANALGNLGIVDEDLGRYEGALTAFQNALAIHRKIANRRGEASDLGNMGIVAAALGRYDDALEAQEDALAIDRAIGNRPGEAGDLNNVGTLAERAGRYGDALRAHRRALEIDRALPNRLGEAEEFGNISVAEERLGRLSQARVDARRAVALANALGARESLWRALRAAARAEARLARRDEALPDYDRALAQIESLRAGLRAQTDRRSFFENKLFVYDEYIAYLQDLDRRFPGAGYDRKALDILERKNARAILEEIGKSVAHRFAGVPESVVADEDETERALDKAPGSLAKLLSAATIDATAVSAAQRRIVDLTARQRRLRAQIQSRYPAYFQLRHPRPLALAELQDHVLAPGEVLLAYDELPEKSVLFVVSRERFQLVPLPAKATLRQGIERLRGHVKSIEDLVHQRALDSELNDGAAEDLPGFAADSFALYQQLIPVAVQPIVAAAKSLIVVPSGALYDLPWEMLVTQPPSNAEPHYLIADHAISYVPSASLRHVVRSASGQRREAADSLLAFARPTFGIRAGAESAGAPARARGGETYESLQLAALRSTLGGGFADLPGTEVEANAVRDALHAPLESVVTGDDATRARVLEMNRTGQLTRFRYLLFATHAVLPEQISGLTQAAIVLAHPDDGQGLLTVDQIFGLSLNADMVALSACNTGAGLHRGGDGISGLTRAFLYAGTPAISVTLWPVDDAAAPQISPLFFAGMNGGESASEALRHAKLRMLQSKDARFRHPFSWAPTVIFGDGERISP